MARTIEQAEEDLADAEQRIKELVRQNDDYEARLSEMQDPFELEDVRTSDLRDAYMWRNGASLTLVNTIKMDLFFENIEDIPLERLEIFIEGLK